MRATRWRTWTGLLVAVALLFTLAGCNAVPKPLIGVTLDANGYPVAVLRLCSDARGTLMGLHRDPKDAPVGPSYTPSDPVFLAQNVSDPAASMSVPLAVPPPAWQVTTRLADTLADGYVYALDVTAPKVPGMTLDFSLADLRGLGTDQIWTLRGVDSVGTVMSVSDFEQRAAKSCRG